MLRVLVPACCLVALLPMFLFAEEPDQIYKEGLAKLREAQFDHAALVPATRLLAQAASQYEANGDEAKAAVVNSALYWAKKKFTLADAEALKDDKHVVQALETAAKPVDPSNAQKWFERAAEFAKGHAGDPLLAAIRYFEVGDRFKDTDAGRQAIALCLKAMQQVGEKAKLAEYKPAPTDGKVFVKSEPPGAAICLVTAGREAMDTKKQTPAVVELPLGRQTVGLWLKGYKPAYLPVDVDGKEIAKPEAVKLEVATVAIDVLFEEGWQVFVDGQRARSAGGKSSLTPCTVELPLGGHEIGLAKEGFRDIRQKVEVTQDGVKEGGGPARSSLEVKAKPEKGAGTLAKDAARALNLLPLLDTQKDTLRGNWKVAPGGLVSDGTPLAFIEIPYRPPEEYDFRVSFTKVQGGDGVALTLTKSGRMFRWAMGGFGNTLMYFELVRGQTGDVNPTRVRAGIPTGQLYTACVQVRNDGLKAFVNGNCVSQWKTDYTDMSHGNDAWGLRDPTILGLLTNATVFVFHSIEVIEVSGTGKKTR